MLFLFLQTTSKLGEFVQNLWSNAGPTHTVCGCAGYEMWAVA